MKKHPDYSDNTYYLHFKNSLGFGLEAPGFPPNFEDVYRYRLGLQRGRGQLLMRRRGLGFASFFSGLFQRAIPVLQSFGSKAIDVVSNIAKDGIHGENLVESAVKNISKAVSNSVTNSTPTVSGPRKRKNVSFGTSAIARKKSRLNSSNYSALSKLQ